MDQAEEKKSDAQKAMEKLLKEGFLTRAKAAKCGICTGMDGD